MKESGSGSQQNNINAEQKITSKTKLIQNKKFFFDVKQNICGKFLKISPVGLGGRTSKIFMSLLAAVQFRDKLSDLSNIYNRLSPHNPDNLAKDGCLKTYIIFNDDKKYYLDLKENERGRFFRMAMSESSNKSKVYVNAQGIIELRNALTEILKDNESVCLPEPKSLKIDNKILYFDVRCNHRGVYLRLTEVKSNYRTAIIIPENSLEDFKQILNSMTEQISDEHLNESKEENKVATQGEILKEYDTDEDNESISLPKAKSIKIDDKILFFDVRYNQRGVYLRVSEVRSNDRTAINIPENSLEDFKQILNSMAKQISDRRLNESKEENKTDAQEDNQ